MFFMIPIDKLTLILIICGMFACAFPWFFGMVALGLIAMGLGSFFLWATWRSLYACYMIPMGVWDLIRGRPSRSRNLSIFGE